MKVSDVKTFLVFPASERVGVIGGKNLLFVKVTTDEGLVGWGEAYTQLDRDRNIEQHIRELGRYLLGRNPYAIKHFTSIVYNDFAARRSSMDLSCAVSAIEQALWDIVGKTLEVPVYNLLGGACRDKIRVYANGWYAGAKTPDEHAQKAAKTVERGFTALKFDPFPGLWRLFPQKEIEERAVANVRAVREAVGPHVDLLIEVHRRLSPMVAVRVARKMEKFDLFWYEEPVPAENVNALAEVRQKIGIPVVTGETLYCKADFRDIFEKRAADIVNPDVSNCGGILELKEIAAMAEPSYIAVAPHNYNSTTVALAATLQVSACIPNFLITEYFVNFEETGQRIAVNPFSVDGGYIRVPSTPGLGLELKEEELERHSYYEYPLRSLPLPTDEGP